MRTFLLFHNPMSCFNFNPDFITALLLNNRIELQLFVIILNCVGMSDRLQHAQDVNAVLFNTTLITLPL